MLTRVFMIIVLEREMQISEIRGNECLKLVNNINRGDLGMCC